MTSMPAPVSMGVSPGEILLAYLSWNPSLDLRMIENCESGLSILVLSMMQGLWNAKKYAFAVSDSG